MGLASIRNTFAAGAVAVAAVAPQAEAGIVTSYFQGTIVADATGLNLNGLSVFGDGGWDNAFPDSFGSPTVGGYLGSAQYLNIEFSNSEETFFVTGVNGNSVFVDSLALPAQDSITFNNYVIDATSPSLNVTGINFLLGNSGINALTSDAFVFDQTTVDSFASGLRRINLETDLGQITIQIESMTVVPTPGTAGLALVGLGAMALGGRRRNDNDNNTAAAPEAFAPQGPA
jgi:hypothetical protein